MNTTAEKSEKTIGANRAHGTSEIEGKVARVATSKLGDERVSMELRDQQHRR